MSKKRIAKIIIDGVIEKKNESYDQEWLLEKIENAGEDKRNAAILVYIDSPGGSVFESDEVYEALKKYSKKNDRPVYAYFASLAASGGYYIGCAAKKIFANRNTITGSIGVIAGQFVDLTQLMEKYGVKTELIHAGKNKVMGHYSEPVTDEQRQIMQAMADECYDQFTQIVAENRNLDIEKVRSLADGRIYTAKQAKENGLVDEVMNFDDAMKQIKKELFNDEEYDADIKEYKLKKKGLRQWLKGAKLDSNGLSAALEVLRPKVAFPAYYWDRGNF